MKKATFLVFVLAIMVSIASCKKNDSPSFVDDYDAQLTEEKGTEHNGDYFPLAPGYSWNYSGFEEVTGEVVYSGGGYDETEPLDESGNVYSMLSVEALENLMLESGTYSVYPVKENYYYDGGSRYYESTSDAIYLRAYTDEDNNIIEVKNALFLKKSLIVGDSWDTQPSVNLEEDLDDGDLGITLGEVNSSVKCKVYVIGEETVTWNGNSVQPIRLDEISEADFSIPLEDEEFSGKMNVNIKVTNILYLLENVGMIQQNLTMVADSKTTLTAEGQKFTIKIDMESSGELNLDSYDLTESMTKRKLKVSDGAGNLLEFDENPIVEKIAKKVIKISDVVKKISSF